MISPLVPVKCRDFGGWSKGNLELHMRWTLFNWLLDVGSPDAMNLNESCFLLCFCLVDRFIEKAATNRLGFSKDHLHILGVAALFLASKMHGVDLVRADEFLYYLDDTHYVESHLVSMERQILQAVEFYFFQPCLPNVSTSFLFHNPFDAEESEQHILFSYLLHLSLLDHRMNPFTLSDIQLAIEQICRVVYPPIVNGYVKMVVLDDQSDTCRDVIVQFIETIHEEKLRIDSGKRTATQRKLTKMHDDGFTIINYLFESLPKLKQLTTTDRAEEKMKITRETRRPSGILTRSQAALSTIGYQDDFESDTDTHNELRGEYSFDVVQNGKKRKRKNRCSHRQDKHQKQNEQKRRKRCKELTMEGKRCKLPAILLDSACEFCGKHK